jgi:hypothetical protein
VLLFREKTANLRDCPNYPWEVLEAFWNKNGWKYKQYKKQLEFIRKNGYEKFLNCVDKWKRAHGKLPL